MRYLLIPLSLHLARSFTPLSRSFLAPSIKGVSSARVAAISSAGQNVVETDDTLLEINFNKDQWVTLIGTAHLSKASNEQVTFCIASTSPDVVMVELDTTRLERIGIESTDELGLPFATADDIQVPLQEDDMRPTTWWMPVQNLLLDAFTRVARTLLTGMYNDMGDSMGEVGGGEFLAAINAAKQNPSCKKIVLGDRDSLITLKRAAELAVRSGDPLGVMARLSEANDAEMEEMQRRVLENAPDDKVNDEAYLTTATIEALKADKEVRSRIFERLEQDVPEFTRAFLTERDYIMAQAILREISSGARHVVAVVGLAHVPGIAANLEKNIESQ